MAVSFTETYAYMKQCRVQRTHKSRREERKHKAIEMETARKKNVNCSMSNNLCQNYKDIAEF